MKTIHLTFWILLSLCANTFYSQVTPNSNKFDIENFIAIDKNGKYSPYTVHGFYENAASGATPRIYILPIFKLDLENIKFINSHGLETDVNSDDIRSMVIPVLINIDLPNESQKAAIIAAVKDHTTIPAYFPDMVRDPITQAPFVSPMIPFGSPLHNQIMAIATKYQGDILNLQQKRINDFNTSYKAQIIDMTELEIIVEAGGEIAYSRRFPASMLLKDGTAKKIIIDKPTEYVKNIIAHGNGEILFSYKFKDSQSSTLNFHADATTIIDQFLSEAYQSSVSQKSKGWSFLGFGSSKKSIKSSFDQQVRQQYNGLTISNTVVEMYDADDQMLKQFENAFFPTLSQMEVIQNHVNAAQKAEAEGNTALRDLHLKLVESLQNNNPNLAPNIEAAVAALGKKDYIGFIANGVRWGDYSANDNNSFRRVINSNEMTNMVKNWSQTKVTSVHHAVTQPVLIPEKVQFKANLGIIDGITYSSYLNMFNGYFTSPQLISGVLIGPITQGGALHLNNIAPGTLMTKIGTYAVNSGQSFRDALQHYKAGDKTSITLILPTTLNPSIWQEQKIPVTLGAYPEIK
ncbi:hypothetical protein [Chryseobacterium lactis]|uniref:hypothetical protein n=1 Tax=Chryseobacterium lactis TaxID=1241981 RepID=UPI00162461FB|nr:hypothetical protein [Chryseobacterium lactis]